MNTQSAKKIAEFCSIARVDADGTIVKVPGHDGRIYFVKVSPSWNTGRIHVTCKSKSGMKCPGNSKSVCYHALAAVLFLNKDAKLCENLDDAERLAHISGKAIEIVSTQSDKIAGAVLRVYRKIAERAENAKAFKNAAHNRSLLGNDVDYLEMI